MRKHIYLAIAVVILMAQSTRADCPANAHVTIVFGNGIETTRAEAQSSLDNVLARAILQALPPTLDQSCISFVLLYDSQFVDSNNELISRANMFAQIVDAGVQIGIDFAANFWSYWYGSVQPPTWFQDLQRQFILSVTSAYQKDLLTQEAFYNAELAARHTVIVVTHSQGNLYANQAFELVTASGGGDAFHIVAVATPASDVAGSGPYFTLHGDVITLVPGHLPANETNDPPSPCPTLPLLVSEACHSFDNSYMDIQNGDHTRPAIVNAVLGFLQSTPKEFAFVANGSGFYGAWSLTLDPSTGTLTPVINPATGLPGFISPGAAPSSIAVAADPAAKFVYVANLGAPSPAIPGNVSGFTVDPATGVLTSVTGSPFSDGVGPVSVVIHPTGKFLYVGNEIVGDISAYTIDSTAGALTQFSPSTLSLPAVVRLGMDPLGRFLFGLAGDVKVFKIDQTTGMLTFASSAPAAFGPASVAADPTGRFVYVGNVSGGVSGYTLDSLTGVLTPIAGSPFSGGTVEFGMTVDPTGKFLYVANGSSKTLGAYRIDPSTGALASVIGSPYATPGCPTTVAVDVSSKFVYVTEACALTTDNILGYSLDQSTGALTPLANSPFNGGEQPSSIVIRQVAP